MNRRGLLLTLAAPWATGAANLPRPALRLVFPAGGQTFDLANS